MNRHIQRMIGFTCSMNGFTHTQTHSIWVYTYRHRINGFTHSINDLHTTWKERNAYTVSVGTHSTNGNSQTMKRYTEYKIEYTQYVWACRVWMRMYTVQMDIHSVHLGIQSMNDKHNLFGKHSMNDKHSLFGNTHNINRHTEWAQYEWVQTQYEWLNTSCEWVHSVWVGIYAQ